MILSTVRIQNQKASPPKNIPLTLMNIKTMIAKNYPFLPPKVHVNTRNSFL